MKNIKNKVGYLIFLKIGFFFGIVLFLFCLKFEPAFAQVTSGKIVYERKINLLKKFKDDEWMKDWLKADDKVKVDVFELYFNDTISVFRPEESELKEKFSWATSKNSTYRNFITNERLNIKDVWGEKVYIRDTLSDKVWKITDSKRNISGFNCRKAIWQANDTTRIYAWYCEEILQSIGPESFFGLPGAIMGLASEDGGVIYFAKKVEIINPDEKIMTSPKIKKIYSSSELRVKLEKEYGKEKWGKEMIKEVFAYW